jgi:protein SCO1/2
MSRLLIALALCLLFPLAGAATPSERGNSHDVTGILPDLSFTMTRASDGRQVTASDYRGKLVMVYFGYTHCPDACPLTLANIAQVLQGLGARAEQVRVLFVTVDPDRDALPVLRAYTDSFAPQVDGLRGSADQLRRFARTYRVAYDVRPAAAGQDVDVMHSGSVLVFGADGRARLLTLSLSDGSGVPGMVADLTRLLNQGTATARPDP